MGCFLLSLLITILPWPPHGMGCEAVQWLIHYAFLFIMGPLAGKTWRIYMIFYMAKTKYTKFTWSTNRLALSFVGIPAVVIFAYLMTWTFVGVAWTRWEVTPTGVNNEYCWFHPGFTATWPTVNSAHTHMYSRGSFDCRSGQSAREPPWCSG